MILGVPNESVADETRAALIPPVADALVDDGHEVLISSGVGTGAGWSDESYRAVGCDVVDDEDVFERSDVVFHVRGLGATPDDDLPPYREGQVVIGLLGPYELDAELDELASRGVDVFALELIPRISRAQSMDAVSSMDSVSGYKATMIAAEALPKLFPMEMTAAGTIQPAEVFVLGAGVAGLKAISTAERLGANATANDVRPEVREEVESLGAEFVEVGAETDSMSDEEGYATEQEKDFAQQQQETLMSVVPDSDVLITTAAIPGRPAPQPISTEMIERMDPGSVVVDLAAESGGNCEPSRPGETVVHDGVEIYGPTNLAATVPQTASKLYANNLRNFLDLLTGEDGLTIDLDDEIIDATLLTHDGEVRAPHREDGEGSDEDGQSDETADASNGGEA